MRKRLYLIDIVLVIVVISSMAAAVIFPGFGARFQILPVYCLMINFFLSYLSIDLESVWKALKGHSGQILAFTVMKLAVLPVIIYFVFYFVAPDFSAKDDLFLFNQGPTKGLGSVQFHDYKPVFEASKNIPNVGIFIKQINLFTELLEKAGPDKAQDMDPSWSLPVGEMFSIVVYGQLILEQAAFDKVDTDVINQIFDFMVRDFARFALQIYGMHNTKEEQRAYCKEIMLIKSQGDDA
ncbi:MAG TPA: hypothetical protein VF343_05960 [Syntrophales bacterium]